MKLGEYASRYGKTELISKIEQIKEVKDPWIAGQKIVDNSPSSEYIKWVQEILGSHPRESQIYKQLWSFDVSGAINFNLDNLLEQENNIPDENTSSLKEGKYKRFQLLNSKWVLHPHGRLNRPDSWVLTLDRRNTILRDNEYKKFMFSAFSTRRFVIVGFQPSDFAYE